MARRGRRQGPQLDMLSKDGTCVRSKRAINKRYNRGGSSNRKRGALTRVAHRIRESFARSTPHHVTLRVERDIPRLRTRELWKAFRAASLVVARRADLGVVHLSVQGNHLHLLVEAENREALARGMQAFQISAAKHINRIVTKRGERRRRGRVFADRYHVEPIQHPAQARRALAYVLNNWRRHGEHRSGEARLWQIDRFSSAIQFDGWKERAGLGRWAIPPDYEPLAVQAPRTWFLRRGWRRYGLISIEELPGSLHE